MSDVAAPQPLVTVDYTKSDVTFTDHANTLKEEALAAGALIGKVEDALQNEQAVAAQQKIHLLIGTIETARKAAKEKPLEIGKVIDTAAKSFSAELKEEMTRISALVGSYQQVQLAKSRAAAQAVNEQLTDLERERAAERAKAKNEEELDAVDEHYARKTRELQGGIPTPSTVKGQKVEEDYDVVITDIHKLYRMHPNCVTLKENLTEIKSLLKQGATVHGITATPKVKATVRKTPQKAAIDV